MNTVQQILELIETRNNWNTALLKGEILKILAEREREGTEEFDVDKALEGMNRGMVELNGKLPERLESGVAQSISTNFKLQRHNDKTMAEGEPYNPNTDNGYFR